MHYRIAGEDDLLQLAQMRWDFHCEDHATPPVESQEAFVDRCLTFLQNGLASGTWTYWVVAENETILGHIFVHIFHPVPRLDRAIANYGYMTNVYTKPAYRNGGLGTTLMQHVIAWARSQPIDFLMVSPSERSVPFYQRAGFANQAEWMQLDLE